MKTKKIKVESVQSYYGNLWINAYSLEERMIHIKLRNNSPYYAKCRDHLKRYIEIPMKEIEVIARGHCGDKKERKVNPLGFLKKLIK